MESTVPKFGSREHMRRLGDMQSAATPIRDEALRQEAAALIQEAREKAMAACRVIDPLCDGKLRLAAQSVLDSATDALSSFQTEDEA